MVRSNHSLGSILLTIVLTLVIFIGAIAGTIAVLVTQVKVRTIAGFFGGEDWISESYDGTVIEVVQKVADALSGDISIDTVIEISPKAEELIDGVLSNVEEMGLFKIDRDALYSTPVSGLSASVMDIVVLTATLADVADFARFELPDMALITGSDEAPAEIYTQVNDTEDGSLAKEFSMSDTEYAYYTRSVAFRDTYTATDEDGTETQEQIVQLQPHDLYALSGVTVQEGRLYLGQARLYLGRTSGEGEEAFTLYSPLGESNDAVYSLAAEGTPAEGEVQAYSAAFALAEGENLYVRTAATADAPDGYAPVNLTATGETVQFSSVATPCLYTALYAKVSAKPAEGEYYEYGGSWYVPANVYGEDGKPAVDTENGGFAVDPAYEGQTLYRLDYDYAPADAAAADADTALYTCTNGVAGLPVIYAMNALSAALDTETLTLDEAGQFLNIPTDNAIFDSIKYIPFAYLSDSMNSAVNDIYLDDVIELDGSSSAILLYLAYGDGYTVAEDGTLHYNENERKTIGQLSGEIDDLVIGNIVDAGDGAHSLLQAISGWTLGDFSDSAKIDGLTLRDVLAIDTSEGSKDAKILQALADFSIGELSDEIENVTVSDILEINEEEDSLLFSLRGSTLATLADDLRAMSVQRMFAPSVYEYHEVFAVPEGMTKAELLKKLDELAGVYGENNLYVYATGDYYNAAAYVGSLGDGEALPAAVCCPYRLVSEAEKENYRDVPLYVLGTDEEGKPAFVQATQVSGWKLNGEDAALFADGPLYVRVKAADGSDAVNEDGDFLYEEASSENGIYSENKLWYYDAAAERMCALRLDPAGYEIKAEYADKDLFTRLSRADVYSAGGTYTQGNLFWFDITTETWQQLPLEANDEGEGYVVKESMLPDGFSLAEGTALYTYGQVRGVWKYLLTEDGKEVFCPVQNVNQFVVNVRENINALTLDDLYADGMVNVTDPTLLTQEIPYTYLPDDMEETLGNAQTVGELSLNQLLELTLAMLSVIGNPGTGA